LTLTILIGEDGVLGGKGNKVLLIGCFIATILGPLSLWLRKLLLDFLLFFQLSLLLIASAASLFHFARHLGNTVMVDGGARWSCVLLD
jgi:hypothetical protein